LAVLDAQLTPQGDGWYQLLPVGPFKARDGRPFDVAIPRAIITTLGSDFQPGQAANGIWVSGGHQGISARVVRQGTAGEQLAQSITHPLVCDVAAARAQGVMGLAKTMPKRTQTIELPLSDDMGLILQGALLAVDGWKGTTGASGFPLHCRTRP
jgi:hypothetical protein